MLDHADIMTDDMPKMRECAVCFSSIDARARRCPHCRERQGRIARILLQPAVMVAFGIWLAVGPVLLGIAGTAMWYHMMIEESLVHSLDCRGADFGDYRDQVTVLESEISFNEREKGKMILIIGRLRNESDLSWESLHLQATFFDAEGNLVDVEQNYLYSYTLPAHSECLFKVSMLQEWSDERYASHEIKVVSAKESDSYGF